MRRRRLRDEEISFVFYDKKTEAKRKVLAALLGIRFAASFFLLPQPFNIYSRANSTEAQIPFSFRLPIGLKKRFDCF